MSRILLCSMCLIALPALAAAERVRCVPDYPVFCANVHFACVGRSEIKTDELTIELFAATARVTTARGTADMALGRDRGARILTNAAPGYIKVAADGRFSQRIYVRSKALMAIGTCSEIVRGG